LNLGQAIDDLERKLAALGFGKSYCESIRKNSTHDRADAHALFLYRAALRRTLAAKERGLLHEKVA